MTLKDLVFAARRHTQNSTGIRLSTGHTYELMAAGFGFNSHADFSAHGAALSLIGVSIDYESHCAQLMPSELLTQRLEARHAEISAPGECAQIAEALSAFFRIEMLLGFRVVELLAHFDLTSQTDRVGSEHRFKGVQHPFFDLSLLEPERQDLTLGLLEACVPNYPDLHYPLARIYDDIAISSDDVDPYWHNQALTGRPLTGVQKEWADQYARIIRHAERNAFHRQAAAANGVAAALVDEMDETGFNPQIESQLRSTSGGFSASLVADIALQSNEIEVAAYWLRRAAVAGESIEAIRWVVEQSAASPTIETWTFIYLSRLLGNDVTASTMRAYHSGGPNDGQEYDDDIGGGMYADGDEALDVKPLSPSDDVVAMNEAQRIFTSIEPRR